MRAKRIALEVLAPENWYKHGRVPNGFELRWLTIGLNVGLAALLADPGPPGLDVMTFTFRSFPHPLPGASPWTKAHYDAAAQSIVEAHPEQAVADRAN